MEYIKKLPYKKIIFILVLILILVGRYHKTIEFNNEVKQSTQSIMQYVNNGDRDNALSVATETNSLIFAEAQLNKRTFFNRTETDYVIAYTKAFLLPVKDNNNQVTPIQNGFHAKQIITYCNEVLENHPDNQEVETALNQLQSMNESLLNTIIESIN